MALRLRLQLQRLLLLLRTGVLQTGRNGSINWCAEPSEVNTIGQALTTTLAT